MALLGRTIEKVTDQEKPKTGILSHDQSGTFKNLLVYPMTWSRFS